MPSEVRQKKIVEKLNRAQKCSILGPQNLGSGGGPGPRGPPLDPHLGCMPLGPGGVLPLGLGGGGGVHTPLETHTHTHTHLHTH